MPGLLARKKHSIVRHGDQSLSFQRRFTTMLDFSSQHVREDNERYGRYRYRYNYPPSRRDPVLRVLRSIIKLLAKNDIAFAGADLRVASTTSSPLIWPPSSEGNQVKFYTFEVFYEEFPLTVPIIVWAEQDAGELSVDMMHVRVKGENIPLLQFLQKLPAREWLLKGSQGIKSQQKWWRENGGSFRFMDLPPELRILVYKHAIGPIYPRTQLTAQDSCNDTLRHEARLTFGNGYNPRAQPDADSWEMYTYSRYASAFVPENRPVISPPNISLLLTNKKIHAEALSAGWSGTLKHFVSLEAFMDVSCARNAPGPTTMFNALSRIELNLTHQQYFVLVGVDVSRAFEIDPDLSKVHYLDGLPKLEELQLRFRSPNDGFDGSPWNNLGFPYTGCQRIMVDWIITLLFPTLKKIPKIKFTGFIKSVTKQKWDHIFQSLKGDQSAEYDYAEEIRAIFRHKSEPPLCTCPRSCKVTYNTRIRDRERFSRMGDFYSCEDFDFDDVATVEEPQEYYW